MSSSTESETEWVYRASASSGSQPTKIHREGCKHLYKIKKVLRKPESSMPEWVERCDDCMGDGDG